MKIGIQPGDVIKHEKFMDVCFVVHAVGQLEYGATEAHLQGWWMNQGFVKSWVIDFNTVSLTLKFDKRSEWLICTDKHADPCLRKCPWQKIA